MNRIFGLFYIIVAALLIVPIIGTIIQAVLPAVEELSTVPELSMWQLMPILILLLILVSGFIGVFKDRGKK